jgi:lysophospholipase L1-like esterase
LLVSLLVLDQLLFWTLATRPASNIRKLIRLTDASEPPYFELSPNLDTTYTTWGKGNVSHIHVNALGFRDVERVPAKKPGMRRVIMAGDSITFGIGVNQDEAFPQELQRRLLERGLEDVEVWNAGVPGYSMPDHLGLLRSRLLALAPDMIVLQIGRNDSAIPMPLSKAFMLLVRVSGLARAWMLLRFNGFHDAARFRSDLRDYADDCRRAEIKLAIAVDGIPDGEEESTLELLREREIPMIRISGEGFTQLPDDPHLDPGGNRKAAQALLPAVLASLGRE